MIGPYATSLALGDEHSQGNKGQCDPNNGQWRSHYAFVAPSLRSLYEINEE